MTGVQAIIIVIIRLWAAGMLISALVSMPAAVSYLFQEGTLKDAMTISIFGANLVFTAVGVIVWFAAGWLARRVTPKSNEQDVAINVDADTLVAIGSFLIGAYYLIEYGLRLLRQITYSLAVSADDTLEVSGQIGSLQQNAMNWQDFSSNLLIVIAAFVMMFRPVYLVRIFKWLRSAGDYKAALAQQDEAKAERS